MTRDEMAAIVTDEEKVEALWRLYAAEQMEAEAAVGKMAEENAAMKQLLNEYEAEKAAQTQAAAEARARQAMEDRFEKAVGDRQFVHEVVRQGVLADFAVLAADPENVGIGDRELLDRLTRGQGYFAKQCPPVMMAGIADVPAADVDKLNDTEYYNALRAKKMR